VKAVQSFASCVQQQLCVLLWQQLWQLVLMPQQQQLRQPADAAVGSAACCVQVLLRSNNLVKGSAHERRD